MKHKDVFSTKRLFMKFLIGLCPLFFSLIAFTQDSMSTHYKIYDTHSKQVIGIDKIMADMADADVFFFGEEHNDSAGHYLENKIFRALHAAYGDKIVLSMEMFETDNQVALNDYLQGFI